MKAASHRTGAGGAEVGRQFFTLPQGTRDLRIANSSLQ